MYARKLIRLSGVLRATEIEEVLLKALKWLEISGLS
jgi:hypothetical protein